MARLNEKVPKTVTYKERSYGLVEQKRAALKTVTYKGAQYQLIAAEMEELPVPEVSSELVPSEDNIYVRMTTDDYQLLASLSEATYGPLRNLLEKARTKKLDSGRAEVMASEDEVDAAISALRAFVESDEAPASITHAQDMLATWKRNYVLPEKPLSKPLPRYTSELPPSSTIRMFHYKGAKYVLVEGAEVPDYLKKRPSPTYEEVIDTEVFSDLVTNIQQAISANIPIAQLKRSVDAIQQAEGSLRSASDSLNNDRAPGVRWLTDAFFYGKHHKDILRKLLEDPELVRESINKYIHDVQTAHAAAQAAAKVTNDISSLIEERGWASKWAMKKGRSALRKDILREFYGMDEREIENFFSKAYVISKERPKRTEEKRVQEEA